jgi:hypothetical protein
LRHPAAASTTNPITITRTDSHMGVIVRGMSECRSPAGPSKGL